MKKRPRASRAQGHIKENAFNGECLVTRPAACRVRSCAAAAPLRLAGEGIARRRNSEQRGLRPNHLRQRMMGAHFVGEFGPGRGAADPDRADQLVVDDNGEPP